MKTPYLFVTEFFVLFFYLVALTRSADYVSR